MAKKPTVPEPDPTDVSDGAASLILRGGPYDGALDVLPEGSVVNRNEILIPAPGQMAIYQRKKDEAGLPTYRYVRSEPVYAIET